MAKADTVKSPTGRTLTLSDDKPAVAKHSGAGRSRKPTEWDDLVPEWLEHGKWVSIPAQGETVDEQLADIEEVYKSLKRAIDNHEVGGDRYKENDPNDPNFQSYATHVRVRPKQNRGPAVGTIKHPETNERISPDDPRYEEVKALKAELKANK